jgi:hypothetical protein
VRIVLGIFTLSAILVGPASAFVLRVSWTESMPRGIHQRVRPALERGAWVAVCLESNVAELARERRCVIDGSILVRSPRIKSSPERGPCERSWAAGNVTSAPV